jgi:hypothetical protein
MPAAAVVTLIGVALAVAAIAGYLIYIALILRHVVIRLNTVLAGVVGVIEESAPIGPVATAINSDLDAARKSLERALPQDPAQSNGHESAGVGVR